MAITPINLSVTNVLSTSVRLNWMRFSPQEVSGMRQWLKASDLALANGDSVTTWAERSGFGIDVTQSTSTKRPTYQTAGIAGRPSVKFNGVDNFLASTTNFGLTDTTPITLFAVVQPDSFIDTYPTIISQHGTDVTNSLSFGMTAGGGALASRRVTTDHWKPRGAAGSTTIVVDTAYVVSWRMPSWQVHATDTEIRIDGVDESASTYGTGLQGTLVDDTLQIGQFEGLTSGYFGGHISELILYEAELSDFDRGRIEAYLMNEYPA